MPRTPKLDTATAHSQELATLFWKDRLLVRNQKTVLVLGATNAGKSTFMRQVRLFSAGYNAQDRLDSASRYATACLKGYEDSAILDEIYDNPKIQATVSTLLRQSNTHQGLTPGISATIRTLWGNPAIQEAIRASSRFQSDSTCLEYFLFSLLRISDPGYTPTDVDILLCKFTSPPAITEIHFEGRSRERTPDGDYPGARPHDVGLQRRLIHLFGAAEAIIFVVALACYDQTNCMRDAMRQFELLCNDRIMSCNALILPMNKLDLFTEKLTCVPFTVCFPDYSGPNEPVPAAAYCIQRFSFLASGPGRKDIRGWCTNALDVEQMHGPLKEIGEFIFDNRIRHNIYAVLGSTRRLSNQCIAKHCLCLAANNFWEAAANKPEVCS
ncbi:G-protein alpha subunit-domain-containing protein [Mycena olivaceomarginata]|nr:G-protein alpha subunit-domain-containing protein [Mycena olivaceomarginata]